MEDVITYAPDLSGIFKWLIGSGLVLLLSIALALRFVKPKGPKHRFHALYFLLSGFCGLIALTIFAFMLFNWIRTKPVQLSKSELIIDDQEIGLNTIRRTKIHREGNGIPFQGIGVNRSTNNSLIVEMSNGTTKILSEDFYPIQEIMDQIKRNKKLLDREN